MISRPPPALQFFAAVLLTAVSALAQPAAAPLKTIGEVRALSPTEAARGKPVSIRGTVTYVAPTGAVLFVQDATGGVCVSGPREKPQLRLGSVVDIEAITAAGRLVPHLTARKREQIKIAVVGDAEIPEPREITLGELQKPENQAVRVQISGVVRSLESRPFGPGVAEMLEITIADGRDRLVVALPNWRPNNNRPEHLIGATVKVRGVYNATTFERQPLFANRLFIPGLREVKVTEAAGVPFDDVAQTIESARDAAADSGQPERILVRGTVTVAVPGRGMYLEDETAAIFVESRTIPAPGAQVEVAGFPASRETSPVLEDSIWRPAKFTAAVTPPLVTAEAALNPALDGRLVQIEALLLTTSSAGEAPTLVLQSGERVFLARCANPRLRLPSLSENSWLRVTGVCVNTNSAPIKGTGKRASPSFHLMMAGPQAVEIAHAPSWWTLRRDIAVVGSMAVLAIAAVGWATTLRRRVAPQTAQIREHLAREAVAQERLRIAGELHDSVQQDLLGITMQLKATDRLLDANPEKAREALTLVNAMVRHSQAETHRAVWDLRASVEEHNDLLSSLEDMLAGLSTDENATVSLTCHGQIQPFPQATERQLLRVTQEAVCNALKHAAASRIDVELRFEDDTFSLIVRDDGRGFDADHPPQASAGHFGLLGMQERAVKLNGEFRIRSRPGQGTTVQLDVPLAKPDKGVEPEAVPSTMPLLPRPTTS
jgi:signal transduction histidine kinase